jgi:hypothetical protein
MNICQQYINKLTGRIEQIKILGCWRKNSQIPFPCKIHMFQVWFQEAHQLHLEKKVLVRKKNRFQKAYTITNAVMR